MINKKGLSDIVATVLIVLLALAAVAIVWGFLRPMFDNAARSTDLKSKCISVDVQPYSCSYNATTIATVVRNVNGNPNQMIVSVVDSAGASINTWTLDATSTPVMPATLGTATLTYTGTYTQNSVKSVSVSGAISDGTSTAVCQDTSILCTWKTGAL